MSEGEFKGVDKRRLQIAKREVKRRRVTSNFGTEVDIGEGAIGSELDVMIGEGTEGSDEVGGVVVKLGIAGDGA